MSAHVDDLHPTAWVVDVLTADHDAVKVGVLDQHRSRVLISREAFPSSAAALDVAAAMAVAIHGGMATSTLPVL